MEINIVRMLAVVALSVGAIACGKKVEVPPAHAGKIMTKDGYQEGIIPPSRFRLAPCLMYCDKLVILDTSDTAREETLSVFMPEDRLALGVGVRITLSLTAAKTEDVFARLSPSSGDERLASIEWQHIYDTYAQQIVLTEVREYISQFSIAEVASSLDRVNSDLRVRLESIIHDRTPFSVRYVGITNIQYPKIITDAQENAAERRERIQQEEAQLEISKVTLERELQETRLLRQIELERAEIEAQAQRIQREVVDPRVLELRRLENERMWIEKWNGVVPQFMMGGADDGNNLLLTIPAPK